LFDLRRFAANDLKYFDRASFVSSGTKEARPLLLRAKFGFIRIIAVNPRLKN